MTSSRSSVALLSIVLGISLGGSPASAQTWTVITQPGGYQVARIEGAAGLVNFGLTCERSAPVMAVQLAHPASRNPAAATVSVGTFTTRIALIRNGATNIWVSVLHDHAFLDALFGSPTGARMAITVDGGQSGAFSLTGARLAIQQALASCYKPATALAASAPSGTQSNKTTAAPASTLAKSGFPFRSGFYATGGSCAAAEKGEGDASIWPFGPKSYHEYEADGNWTFGRITQISPDHFRTSGDGGVEWERKGSDGFVRRAPGAAPQVFHWCAPLTVEGISLLK